MKKYVMWLSIVFIPAFSFGQLPQVLGSGERAVTQALGTTTAVVQRTLATTATKATAQTFNTAVLAEGPWDGPGPYRKGCYQENWCERYAEEFARDQKTFYLFQETHKELVNRFPDFASEWDWKLDLPSRDLSSRINNNLLSVPGTNPPYGSRQANLPIEDKLKPTQKILDMLFRDYNGEGAQTFAELFRRNFFAYIPTQAIIEGGQMPVEGLDILQNVYRKYLQFSLNNIKQNGELTLDDWYITMQVVLDLGFFGTAEDAAAIAEFAKIVPEDLVPLTELNVVTALLNLNDPAAYKELHNLAAMRAEGEGWFDSDAPQEGKKSLNAHLTAAQYIYSTNRTLDPIAYAVYPRSFASSELNPWISRYSSIEMAYNHSYLNEESAPIQAKHMAHLVYQLSRQNELMRYFLNNIDTRNGLPHFLSLKSRMSPTLVLSEN